MIIRRRTGGVRGGAGCWGDGLLCATPLTDRHCSVMTQFVVLSRGPSGAHCFGLAAGSGADRLAGRHGDRPRGVQAGGDRIRWRALYLFGAGPPRTVRCLRLAGVWPAKVCLVAGADAAQVVVPPCGAVRGAAPAPFGGVVVVRLARAHQVPHQPRQVRPLSSTRTITPIAPPATSRAAAPTGDLLVAVRGTSLPP